MRFENLLVVKEVEPHIRANGKKVRKWLCRCDCGSYRTLNRQELITGKRKSCGCKKKEHQKASATIHGDSHSRIHNIWSGMRERCYTVTDPHYKWYGERGIFICDEWRNDYQAFKKWALENGYQDDLTIDRVDNDGPYSPENCRWVTSKRQSNNTRRNHFVDVDGERHTLAEWEEISGTQSATIRRRLKLGWKNRDAVFGKKQGRK